MYKFVNLNAFCRFQKVNYQKIIFYPLAELNQRMLNPSYRFPIY